MSPSLIPTTTFTAEISKHQESLLLKGVLDAAGLPEQQHSGSAAFKRVLEAKQQLVELKDLVCVSCVSLQQLCAWHGDCCSTQSLLPQSCCHGRGRGVWYRCLWLHLLLQPTSSTIDIKHVGFHLSMISNLHQPNPPKKPGFGRGTSRPSKCCLDLSPVRPHQQVHSAAQSHQTAAAHRLWLAAAAGAAAAGRAGCAGAHPLRRASPAASCSSAACRASTSCMGGLLLSCR